MSRDGPDDLAAAADALIPRDLLRAIFGQYRMSWMGPHGIGHWARVLHNGLHLAEAHGGDRRVGIRPEARYPSTARARDSGVIAAATHRAVSDHVHDVVTRVWLPLAQQETAGP